MGFLLAALLALLGGPALADTVVTKDGKSYRCPGAFGMVEETRVFTCPSYTIEDPDRVEYERDREVGAGPARPAPPASPPVAGGPPAPSPPAAAGAPAAAASVAAPAPAGNVPSGAVPPAGATTVDIQVGTSTDAIWLAMQQAKALPADAWAVLTMPEKPLRIGGTATVIDRAKTIIKAPQGGRGAFDCSGLGSWWGGKGCVIVYKPNVHFENIDFYGAKKVSNTAALFVEEGRDQISVRGARFWNSHNGILAANGSSMLIEDTEFWDNGSGDDKTHNFYSNGVELVLRRVKSYYTGWGKTVQVLNPATGKMEAKPAPIQGVHGIKARTTNLLIEDSDIMAGRGAALDVPYGGQVIVRNTVFRRPDGQFGNIVMIGMESYDGRQCTRGDGPTRLENITVVNERHSGAMVNACPSPAYVAGGKIPDSVNLSGFVRQ